MADSMSSAGLAKRTQSARTAWSALALALVGVVLAACSPSSAGSQPPSAGQVATSGPVNSLASGDEAEGAKFLLDNWLATLNSTQQNSDGTKFLQMQMDPPDWGASNEAAILGGAKSTDPLRVNFLAGELEQTFGPWAGHKLIGTVEFNNVHIGPAEELALSDADKANGFSYMARYKIEFVARIYRRFQESASAVASLDPATIEPWLHEAVPLDPALLSTWSDAQLSRQIGMKDGAWGDFTNAYQSYGCDPSDTVCFNEFDIPFGTAPTKHGIVFEMYGCMPIDVQGYDASGSPVTTPCQIEKINLGPTPGPTLGAAQSATLGEVEAGIEVQPRNSCAGYEDAYSFMLHLVNRSPNAVSVSYSFTTSVWGGVEPSSDCYGGTTGGDTLEVPAGATVDVGFRDPTEGPTDLTLEVEGGETAHWSLVH